MSLNLTLIAPLTLMTKLSRAIPDINISRAVSARDHFLQNNPHVCTRLCIPFCPEPES